MSKMIITEENLRESLKRCPQPCIDAAVQYHKTGQAEMVPTIVLGIIERFVEPEVRPVIREGRDETRIFEDLGIDSLLMVEIIMLVEETLNISIENEELRNIRTIGDLKVYLDCKIRGLPLPSKKAGMGFEDIAAILPHQPPFLFLQEARINGEDAEGSYRISGDEPFLEGHFKGDPIFPASLMLEALGQLAVLFLLKNNRNHLNGSNKVFFTSCDGVRCHKICRPEDVLQLKVRLTKIHEPFAKFEGTVMCNGDKVAFAEELTLSFDLRFSERE